MGVRCASCARWGVTLFLVSVLEKRRMSAEQARASPLPQRGYMRCARAFLRWLYTGWGGPRENVVRLEPICERYVVRLNMQHRAESVQVAGRFSSLSGLCFVYETVFCWVCLAVQHIFHILSLVQCNLKLLSRRSFGVSALFQSTAYIFWDALLFKTIVSLDNRKFEYKHLGQRTPAYLTSPVPFAPLGRGSVGQAHAYLFCSFSHSSFLFICDLGFALSMLCDTWIFFLQVLLRHLCRASSLPWSIYSHHAQPTRTPFRSSSPCQDALPNSDTVRRSFFL